MINVGDLVLVTAGVRDLENMGITTTDSRDMVRSVAKVLETSPNSSIPTCRIKSENVSRYWWVDTRGLSLVKERINV